MLILPITFHHQIVLAGVPRLSLLSYYMRHAFKPALSLLQIGLYELLACWYTVGIRIKSAQNSVYTAHNRMFLLQLIKILKCKRQGC